MRRKHRSKRPAHAMAKVSMRIVPDQDAERISRAFDDAVRAATPDTVKLKIITHATAPAYLAPLDSPGIQAAGKAMQAGFGKPAFFTREGGTLPILPLFKEILGADSLMMGLCHPDCNAHGPDEFFGVAELHAGVRTGVHFLQALAETR